MSRILVFVDVYESFTLKYLSNLVDSLSSNNKITLYAPINKSEVEVDTIVDSDLEYLVKSASYKVYDNFFKFLASQDFDVVAIPRIRFLEYFLLNLLSTKQTNIRFTIGMFGLNNFVSNKMREKLINLTLAETDNIKFLIHSNDWYENHNLILIKKVLKSEHHVDRILLTSDPVYDKRGQYLHNNFVAKSLLKIDASRKYILFFGNPFYGKGLDLLLDKIDSIPNDFNLLISTNLETSNFNLNTSSLNHERVTLINRFVNEDEAGLLFSAADIVCLPYRNNYLYGTSGVLVQSALAGKPILCSNIRPFSSVVDKFKVGRCVNFESVDLGILITEIENSKVGIDYRYNWDKYLFELNSWNDISSLYK